MADSCKRALRSPLQKFFAAIRAAARPVRINGLNGGLLALGNDQGKKVQILSPHFGPEHGLGVLVSSTPGFRVQCGIGYPIASGVIEGACRHLVKDRMERSGMRWTLEGARSMLNVRAAFQSAHWRTFVDWHMKAEITRTHPNQNLLQGYTPPTLAC